MIDFSFRFVFFLSPSLQNLVYYFKSLSGEEMWTYVEGAEPVPSMLQVGKLWYINISVVSDPKAVGNSSLSSSAQL